MYHGEGRQEGIT